MAQGGPEQIVKTMGLDRAGNLASIGVWQVLPGPLAAAASATARWFDQDEVNAQDYAQLIKGDEELKSYFAANNILVSELDEPTQLKKKFMQLLAVNNAEAYRHWQLSDTHKQDDESKDDLFGGIASLPAMAAGEMALGAVVGGPIGALAGGAIGGLVGDQAGRYLHRQFEDEVQTDEVVFFGVRSMERQFKEHGHKLPPTVLQLAYAELNSMPGNHSYEEIMTMPDEALTLNDLYKKKLSTYAGKEVDIKQALQDLMAAVDENNGHVPADHYVLQALGDKTLNDMSLMHAGMWQYVDQQPPVTLGQKLGQWNIKSYELAFGNMPWIMQNHVGQEMQKQQQEAHPKHAHMPLSADTQNEVARLGGTLMPYGDAAINKEPNRIPAKSPVGKDPGRTT